MNATSHSTKYRMIIRDKDKKAVFHEIWHVFVTGQPIVGVFNMEIAHYGTEHLQYDANCRYLMGHSLYHFRLVVSIPTDY